MFNQSRKTQIEKVYAVIYELKERIEKQELELNDLKRLLRYKHDRVNLGAYSSYNSALANWAFWCEPRASIEFGGHKRSVLCEPKNSTDYDMKDEIVATPTQKKAPRSKSKRK